MKYIPVNELWPIVNYPFMQFYLMLFDGSMQIVVWRFLNKSHGSGVLGTKKMLLWIVIVQYIPRSVRILPLFSELKKTVGVITETAWAGAAYYLVWFVLAGHVSFF